MPRIKLTLEIPNGGTEEIILYDGQVHDSGMTATWLYNEESKKALAMIPNSGSGLLRIYTNLEGPKAEESRKVVQRWNRGTHFFELLDDGTLWKVDADSNHRSEIPR